MGDMAPVIAPKSDRLTADDLISGDRVIRITGVKVTPGDENPCAVSFEGDNSKPWYPCKTMGRVLVEAWGPDSSGFVGKSLHIYRDPNVTWAGMKVGGIRIKALSDIPRPFEMALTETRGRKAVARFHPLKVEQPVTTNDEQGAQWAAKFMATVNRAPDAEKLDAFANPKAEQIAGLPDDLRAACEKALADKRATFAPESEWETE